MEPDPITSVLFASIVKECLGHPGVTYPPAESNKARGFGSTALKVDGKVFAMVDRRGRFVVKLPAARVLELLSDGRGTRFEMGRARWTKEWVCLVPGTEEQWPALAREALEMGKKKEIGNK